MYGNCPRAGAGARTMASPRRAKAHRSSESSFARLRLLADSFRVASGSGLLRGEEQRRAVALAAGLGATALPLLERKLRSTVEREASWAYYLLARMGGVAVVAFR